MARRRTLLPMMVVAAGLVSCAAALLALAGKAEAAFPGRNGDIAFTSSRPIPGAPCCSTAEIYRVGADGSGLTRLTDPPSVNYASDWSPDGKKIAFVKYADQTRTFRGAIYTIDADGQNQVKVLDFPDGTVGDPQWFPGGKKIAFVGRRNGSFDLYVVELGPDGKASGEPTRLTSNPTPDFHPAVSPGGKKIAFVSQRGRGTYRDIYVIRADAPEGPDNPARLLAGLRDSDEAPDWSPGGKKVVFHKYESFGNGSQGGTVNIYAVDSDGGGLTKLTYSRPGYPRSNYLPSFSPDGRWVLFERDRLESEGNTDGADLWKMRADGTDKQRVVGNARGGTWQPLR